MNTCPNCSRLECEAAALRQALEAAKALVDDLAEHAEVNPCVMCGAGVNEHVDGCPLFADEETQTLKAQIDSALAPDTGRRALAVILGAREAMEMIIATNDSNLILRCGLLLRAFAVYDGDK